MPHDVFVSYPHQNKAVADAACAKLEAARIRCWIAPRDVPPGTEWAAAIVEAIDGCKVMVLIFSSHANQSRQIHREVQQAFDGEKPVVPFRVEDVLPAGTLRYYMGTVHWLDALTLPLEEHLDRLANSVGALVTASAQSAHGNQPDATSPMLAENRRPTDLGFLQKNKIFVCSKPASSVVPWVELKLREHYGGENVVSQGDFDWDRDFRRAVVRGMEHCKIVVAVLGPGWADNGLNDNVRIVLETAFHLRLPVVPVMLDGADMPPAEKLPEGVRYIRNISGAHVSRGHGFETDVTKLIAVIDKWPKDPAWV